MLTPREAEILTQLRAGLSTKAIAQALSISPHTVNVHTKRLFKKMGVNSREQITSPCEGLLRRVTASLAAAISLLESGAPSNTMRAIMIEDYKRSLEASREHLNG